MIQQRVNDLRVRGRGAKPVPMLAPERRVGRPAGSPKCRGFRNVFGGVRAFLPLDTRHVRDRDRSELVPPFRERAHPKS